MLTDNDPLADRELEATFIAELLRRPEKFLARGLSLDHFTVPLHVATVRAAHRLWEAGEPVNVDTVALDLQRQNLSGLSDGVRGLAALAAAYGKLPDEDLLRRFRRRRAVHTAAMNAIEQTLSDDLDQAIQALAGVDQLGNPTRRVRTIGELAEAFLETIADPETFRQNRIYLGSRQADDAVGKLPVGGLLVLAGDTNVSKSMAVLGICHGMASAGITCGYISLEDPDDIVSSRYISAHTETLSSQDMLQGRFADHAAALAEARRAVTALRQKHGDRVLAIECQGETDIEICGYMSQMAQRGARVVVIDYLQQVIGAGRHQDRRNEIRAVVQRLKAHAKRLGVALILVSQIVRSEGAESEKRCPSKHALKESGDITNAAESIVMLWRKKNVDREPVRAQVVKSKWGGVGRTYELERTPTGWLVPQGEVGIVADE